MRDFVNKHGAYIAAIAIVVAVAAWYLFARGPKPPDVSKGFFIDEDTGQEFILTMDQFPPRTGPNGKILVQEIKYTCDGGKTVKVAYYQKFSDGAKLALEKNFATTGKVGGIDVGGSLVRSPEKGSKWLSSGTPEAANVMKMSCPDGGEIENALP